MAEQIQNQAGSADGGAGLATLFGQQPTNAASAAQPTAGAGVNGGGQATPQQQYMTAEQVEAMLQQRMPEILTAAERKAQSVSDAAASKAAKAQRDALAAVNAQIKAITDQGGSVPPAVQEAWREQALSQVIEPAPQAQPQPAATTPQQPAAEQRLEPVDIPDWVENRAAALEQRMGLQLTAEDPELAQIDKGLLQRDPIQLLELYEAALTAKKQRMTGQPPSRAAMPTMGTAGSPVNLEQAYKSEVLKAAGDGMKIREIRRRYQAQGLDTGKVKFP